MSEIVRGRRTGEGGGGTSALEIRHLSKRYPPNIDALMDISLRVDPGEVVALLGANGAGKSTLTKVLTGVEAPTSGEIFLSGVHQHIMTPAQANRLGVIAVHQELPLLPNLSAAENCFLGMAPTAQYMLRAPFKAYESRYQAIAALIPDPPSPTAKVGDLSLAGYQKVALVRALAATPKVLLLDEVTSSLGSDERREVYRTVRHIARTQRIAVIYITHFIDDALGVSDRVVVLRDGRVALAERTAEVSTPTILAALGATSLVDFSVEKPTRDPQGPGAHLSATFRVVGVVADKVGPVTLDVRPGECLGVYGHPGCGANELLQAVAGFRPYAGEMEWQERPLTGGAPGRVRANIMYCSGDRGRNLIQDWTVHANVGLPSLFRGRPLGRPQVQKDLQNTADIIARFGVIGRPSDAIKQLSGGNQQKVAIGRMAIRGNPLLILGDDLTRGVDVVARANIHQLLKNRLQEGASILLYSSDPEEIVVLCTRVIILAEGHPVEYLQGPQITVSALETVARIRHQQLAR